MKNKTMEKMIENGECECVDLIGWNASQEFQGYGTVYQIPDKDYMGKDLCISKTEEWIWSVGRHKKNGLVFASTTPHFYKNETFECIWLR